MNSSDFVSLQSSSTNLNMNKSLLDLKLQQYTVTIESHPNRNGSLRAQSNQYYYPFTTNENGIAVVNNVESGYYYICVDIPLGGSLTEYINSPDVLEYYFVVKNGFKCAY